MDPLAYRGSHYRLLGKRQDLGDLGGIFATSNGVQQPPTTVPPAQPTGNNSGGLGSILTSIIGGVSSSILPSLGLSPTPTSSTHSYFSSTGSTSPTQTTTSTSATHTSTPTTSASQTVYTSSDGTSVVYLTSTLSSPSATANHHTSFLQNPPLEGGVFALIGVVVLLILFTIITCTLRKRRRNRLERDLAAAITFDPGATEQFERHEEMMAEKRRVSGSSSGHGHGYGYGYGAQPAYAPQRYHGPAGYGQYSAAPAYGAPAYGAPAPYRAPSPTAPEPAQGGANLKRKFSDRKPVPAHLLDPAPESSGPYVSVPPQIYQQQ